MKNLLIICCIFAASSILKQNANAQSVGCQTSFTSVPVGVLNSIQFNSTTPTFSCTTYLWNFGDGTTDNSANPLHVYSLAGVYNVCLTVTTSFDSCFTLCTSSNCQNINVGGSSTCSANFNLYPDSVTPHTYWITNMSAGVQPLSYVWSWGDSTFDYTALPSHTYATAGYYDICLTIADASACSSTLCNSFQLQRGTNSNSMLFVSVVAGTTGLNDQPSLLSKSLYPNPARDKSSISYFLNTASNVAIALYDMKGEKVQEALKGLQPIGENSHNFNVSSLPAGIYSVKIYTGSKIITDKLTVIH